MHSGLAALNTEGSAALHPFEPVEVPGSKGAAFLSSCQAAVNPSTPSSGNQEDVHMSYTEAGGALPRGLCVSTGQQTLFHPGPEVVRKSDCAPTLNQSSVGHGQQQEQDSERGSVDSVEVYLRSVTTPGNPCSEAVKTLVQDVKDEKTHTNLDNPVCEGQNHLHSTDHADEFLVHANLSGMRARRAVLLNREQSIQTGASIIANTPCGFKASSLKVTSQGCALVL